jgi:hypothetical protein
VSALYRILFVLLSFFFKVCIVSFVAPRGFLLNNFNFSILFFTCLPHAGAAATRSRTRHYASGHQRALSSRPCSARAVGVRGEGGPVGGLYMRGKAAPLGQSPGGPPSPDSSTTRGAVKCTLTLLLTAARPRAQDPPPRGGAPSGPGECPLAVAGENRPLPDLATLAGGREYPLCLLFYVCRKGGERSRTAGWKREGEEV